MKGFLALMVAALAGGGISYAIGAVLYEPGTTTVIQEAADEGTRSPAAAVTPAASSPADSRTIGELYRTAAPGVVQVTSTQVVENFFGQQSARSLGSGFVIDKAGHIVTNYHVVQNAQDVEVNFSGGDDNVPARVVGTDPSTDIAVLQVDAPNVALTPLPLGDSDAIQVGDAVVAIGNPFGLDRTVTAGIVSALQREIRAPNGFTIDHVIQTDAQINSGNSGGPLLNAGGEVIGVNSQIATADGSSGNVGIGFAVPINTVREVVSQLIESGKVERAYLGITMKTIDDTLTSNFRLPVDEGVLVETVAPGSPADKAGLKGGRNQVVIDGTSWNLGGDVIVAIDGSPVASAEEVRDAVQSMKPGDRVELEIKREDETMTVSVQLGRQPAQPSG